MEEYAAEIPSCRVRGCLRKKYSTGTDVNNQGDVQSCCACRGIKLMSRGVKTEFLKLG